MEKRIVCSASEDECFQLAISLARLMRFTFDCLSHYLKKMITITTNTVIEKCCHLLLIITRNPFLFSLLHVGTTELVCSPTTDESFIKINFAQVLELCQAATKTQSENKNWNTQYQKAIMLFVQHFNEYNPNWIAKRNVATMDGNSETCEDTKLNFNLNDKRTGTKFSDCLSELVERNELQSRTWLQNVARKTRVDDLQTTSLNCAIAFDAIINPTAAPYFLANQLYQLAIINQMPFSQMCCELIKCCFVCLVDSLNQDTSPGSSVSPSASSTSAHVSSPLLSRRIPLNPQATFLQHLKSTASSGPFSSSCFSSNSSSSKENIRWASFTYFKMPQVFQQLKRILKQKHNLELNIEFGLRQLLQYIPLLELIDFKSNCDCLEVLLKEFIKCDLISESCKESLLKQKTERCRFFTIPTGSNFTADETDKLDQSRKLKPMENMILTTQGQVLTSRAEPTVNSILKTLDSDYSRNTETLFQVLCQMIPSKSFELIVNTLTFTGKLRNFCCKLIAFNESNRYSGGENSKQAAIRAYLFDVTYLMLFYIVQNYGQETILGCSQGDFHAEATNRASKTSDDAMTSDSNATKSEMDVDMDTSGSTPGNQVQNSFFIQFCREFLSENIGKFNYEEKFVRHLDDNKVDQLLNQFWGDNFSDLQLVKWNEVLMNSVGVFREALTAYLHGAISLEKLTSFVQTMTKRYCCIGLVISYYLINRMNVLNYSEQQKCLNVLNFMIDGNNFSSFFSSNASSGTNTTTTTAPLSTTGGNNSAAAGTSTTASNISGDLLPQNFYKERYVLMNSIVKRLMQEFLSPSLLTGHQHNRSNDTNNEPKSSRNSTLPVQMSQQISLQQVFRYTFSYCVKRNWLDYNAIHTFDRLLLIGGANWFVNQSVQILLHECDYTELPNAVDLLFGVCLLDIEQCSHALLNDALPQRLIAASERNVFVEPKLHCLAKLVSAVIYATLYHYDERDSETGTTVARRSSRYYLDDFGSRLENLPFQYYSSSVAKKAKLTDRCGSIHDQFDDDSATKHFECRSIVEGTPMQHISHSHGQLNREHSEDNIENEGDRTLSPFHVSICRMLRLLSSIIHDRQVSQSSCFPLVLLQQLLFMSKNDAQIEQINRSEESSDSVAELTILNDLRQIFALNQKNNLQKILRFLPYDAVFSLIKLLPNSITYEFVVSICNLDTRMSRRQTARALCQLARAKRISSH